MKFAGLGALCLAGVFAMPVSAATIYDANVTNDVIFGSGNANGAFTVEQDNGVEIGLRGKLRFNESNSAENTFNSNGDGSYTFDAGLPPTGFGFAPGSPTTALWNFEWSINSNFDGTGDVLSAFDYILRIDGDPTAGTDFSDVFDPINVAIADHGIGTNATGNGGGAVAADATGYQALIDSNNLAQNSWNYEFFNDGPAGLAQLASFNPNTPGTYTISLTAYEQGTTTYVSGSSIDIIVSPVPLPAALPLLAGALGLLGFARRRRKA